MRISKQEQKSAAREFIEKWTGRGDEKSETHNFWIELLRSVLGIASPEDFIEFEKRVHLDHTSFIDAYIPSTQVLIEQKSIDIDLKKSYKQSDGSSLTPYQQAHRYAANMKRSEMPRWIVICNFKSFLIYDMEKPKSEPEEIDLSNLEKEFYRLSFLSDSGDEHLKREMELSIKAGEIVGMIYDKLLAQYKEPDSPKALKGLNMLCVRLVFCLYAEDAGLFNSKSQFHDYLETFNTENIRQGLISLFKVLDTKKEDRDKELEDKLMAFPYVNGGLFTEEDLSIPQFNEEIRNLLLKKASESFDWSEISPTIFGAVFESTLNPETRRSGGMHYTSIENIHKVIDPLFMDELKEELEEIKKIDLLKKRQTAIYKFQDKISSLKFLDPACGSGNFLTEGYLSLARLEIDALKSTKGDDELFVNGQSKVSIHQFYGIEINDFAVTVAKTALWIAESQVASEVNEILKTKKDFLPLVNYANIVEGNALQMDWTTLEEKYQGGLFFADKLKVYKTDKNFGEISVQSPVHFDSDFMGDRHFKNLSVITNELEETELLPKQSEPIVYDYIMGNPPFVGYAYQTESQKQDLKHVAKDMGSNIDYVVGWYVKASDLIQGTQTKCAFVSTNSITQGEQVAEVWKPLFTRKNIQFDFAYKTFVWDSESSQKAHVHCVILGFSDKNSRQKKKIIFDGESAKEAANINPYLFDAPTIFIEKRKQPLCSVSKINKGSQATDGGNLLLSESEYEELIRKEPDAKKFIREFLGAEEFINGKKRYCLWLVNASPNELRKIPSIKKRVSAVKQMRLESPKESTQNWAAYPYLFTENRQPESGNYLLIPRVSSERRRYIPIGFLDSSVIASDAVQIVPNASLYEFGILTSNVHNAWMRLVCGRLKSDYRYSNDIVYNNFPWPNPTSEQKSAIEKAAQDILDARSKYPESSLADLYDENFMPKELNDAHRANDEAVMEAYGFGLKMKESECVAELFKLYEKLTGAP